MAYRLKLSPLAMIHPVFHISQLRKAIGDYTANPELPATLTEDLEVVMEPLELMGVHQKEDEIKEVLIQWKNLPDYEATWEPYERMKQQFPDFHLKHKMTLWEDGIVTPVHIEPAQPAKGPAQFHYRRWNSAAPLSGSAKQDGARPSM
ncbi:hypothetical protein KFK09_019668 [Dendrobium nobile]|uniref:Chromo domain-containing protein n=1 Tax=Dendrobium nobile TaxID=94219 RepID=A0A8T3AXB8_DENNO|nr:hypothetical protein KFK09_019668 [Dendrobium nobile]